MARTFAHLARVLLGATLSLTTPSVAEAWELLIPRQSEWSYLDDGSDQGTAWREPDFGGNWAAGRAAVGIARLRYCCRLLSRVRTTTWVRLPEDIRRDCNRPNVTSLVLPDVRSGLLQVDQLVGASRRNFGFSPSVLIM